MFHLALLFVSSGIQFFLYWPQSSVDIEYEDRQWKIECCKWFGTLQVSISRKAVKQDSTFTRPFYILGLTRNCRKRNVPVK